MALTWQLAVAFGQGAGTLHITTAAAEAVFNHYQQRLGPARDWDAIALRMLEFMRALGAASQMWALRRGSAVIDVDDVGAAIAKLNPRQAHPLSDCPVCLQ